MPSISPLRLTPEQEAAVALTGLPTLVTAAAGSGKTSVLVARFIALLDTGIAPHEILCVTFTTDAAMELQERILRQLKARESSGDLITQVQRSRFIGTIHSFCFFILNEFGSLIQKQPIENILSSYELLIGLEQSYDNWLKSLSVSSLNQHLEHFNRLDLKTLFETLYFEKEKLKHIAETQTLPEPLGPLFQSTLPFHEALDHAFHEKGNYRFQDLEHLSLRILKGQPIARTRLQTQFKALLIDEFQDTSRLQWEILGQIIGTDRHKLFLVGDPKQSIYSFRDADVSLFNELHAEFEQNHGSVCVLNTNFRTEPTLLSKLNEWSSELFKEGTIGFTPMHSGKSEGGGRWKLLYYEEPTDSTVESAEIDAAVEHVKDLLNQGIQAEEIALLFRMNDRLDLYAKALQARGIPTQASQTVPLFKCYDILDILSFLQAVADPRNDFALGAFLLSPYLKFDIAALLEMRATREKQSQGIFSQLLEGNFRHLQWFFNLTEKQELSLNVALKELFRNTTYFPRAKEAFLELLGPLTEKDYTIKEAIHAMEVWKRQNLDFRQESFHPSGNAVNLMTVHGAKGLEFSHVLLVDTLRRSPTRSPLLLLPDPTQKPGVLVPGIRYQESGEAIKSPQYEGLKSAKDLLNQEEARRILYVALTRAKQSLTIFLPREAKKIPKGSWAEFFIAAENNYTR